MASCRFCGATHPPIASAVVCSRAARAATDNHHEVAWIEERAVEAVAPQVEVMAEVEMRVFIKGKGQA